MPDSKAAKATEIKVTALHPRYNPFSHIPEAPHAGLVLVYFCMTSLQSLTVIAAQSRVYLGV